MDKELINKLFDVAFEYRKRSYSPYSHFQVGAALLAKDGSIWGGCNIENASYTPTNCAERTAFFKAVSEGVTEFDAIVILGGREGEKLDFCAPCGVCRQVMTEFCDAETFMVYLGESKEDLKGYTLKDLHPFGFTKENL